MRPVSLRLAVVLSLAAILSLTAGLVMPDVGAARTGRVPRIVGGTPATNGEFPFVASIHALSDGVHACDGALIDREWVLTVAHCLHGVPPPYPIGVTIGRTKLSGSGGESHYVSDIKIHPSYNPTTKEHDVALVRLAQPSGLTPIQLAFSSNRDLWEPGDSIQIVGWGALSAGGIGPDELMKVTVPIVSDDMMASTFVYGQYFKPSTMVGAGVLTGGKGTCDGDSGSPMFASSTSGRRLVGSVSMGGQYCAAPYAPTIGARVAEGDISRWLLTRVPALANDGALSRSGDFNRDGRDDVVTFTRGTSCDVFVATSLGYAFSAGTKWHDSFACNEEVPLVGDVNGDGRDDILTFTRGSSCDVYVAISNGSSFVGTAVKWHDMFACGSSIPAIGDFDGNDKDDMAWFTRGVGCDVFVSLSTGTTFVVPVKWHDGLGCGNEIPAVGDFNGDGRDDVATFTRGFSMDVFVAISTGTAFVGTGWKWHDFFNFGPNVPAVADFNGDGRDDLVTFTRGTTCDAYVALNAGLGFGTESTWHDGFACNNEIPGTGDFNGDGWADVVTFTRGAACDVWVARSNTTGFGPSSKWSDSFGCGAEIPAGATTW